MCKYCDPSSTLCEIWNDGLTKEPYLDVNTGEYDKVGDQWIYVRVYGIRFCPYCGEELEK